jgi:hypothetical protein
MVARLQNFKRIKITIQRQRIMNDLQTIPRDETIASAPMSLKILSRAKLAYNTTLALLNIES